MPNHLNEKENLVSNKNEEDCKKIARLLQTYWANLLIRHPDISMLEPNDNEENPFCIELGREILPRNIAIYHYYVEGIVDLQFKRLGQRALDFINHFEDEIATEMKIFQANEYDVYIRMTAPKFGPNDMFEDQKNNMDIAQDTAKKLLNWFRENFNLWVSFHEQAK